MAQHSNSSTQEEKEALLIDFGVVPQTARYFINLTLPESREGLRLYGIRSTLARRLMRIGYEITPAAITEGKRLDFRCRVRLVRNGFFTQVEELLPLKAQQEGE